MSVWPIPPSDADVDIPVRHGAPLRAPSNSTEVGNSVGVAASLTSAGPNEIYPASVFPPLASIVSGLRLTNEVQKSAAIITMLEIKIRANYDRLMIRKDIAIRWMRMHEDSMLRQLLTR